MSANDGRSCFPFARRQLPPLLCCNPPAAAGECVGACLFGNCVSGYVEQQHAANVAGFSTNYTMMPLAGRKAFRQLPTAGSRSRTAQPPRHDCLMCASSLHWQQGVQYAGPSPVGPWLQVGQAVLQPHSAAPKACPTLSHYPPQVSASDGLALPSTASLLPRLPLLALLLNFSFPLKGICCGLQLAAVHHSTGER